jgi:hypothetical protein
VDSGDIAEQLTILSADKTLGSGPACLGARAVDEQRTAPRGQSLAQRAVADEHGRDRRPRQVDALVPAAADAPGQNGFRSAQGCFARPLAVAAEHMV